MHCVSVDVADGGQQHVVGWRWVTRGLASGAASRDTEVGVCCRDPARPACVRGRPSAGARTWLCSTRIHRRPGSATRARTAPLRTRPHAAHGEPRRSGESERAPARPSWHHTESTIVTTIEPPSNCAAARNDGQAASACRPAAGGDTDWHRLARRRRVQAAQGGRTRRWSAWVVLGDGRAHERQGMWCDVVSLVCSSRRESRCMDSGPATAARNDDSVPRRAAVALATAPLGRGGAGVIASMGMASPS